MGKAFTYMFNDNKIWLKWLLFAVVMFLSKFFADYASTLLPSCRHCYVNIPVQYWIYLLIGTLVSFISFGYMYSCIKSHIDADEGFILPNIKLWDNFVRGFKYSVAFMLLFIPFSVLNGIIMQLPRYYGMAGLITAYITIFAIGLVFAYIIIGFSWIFANKPTFLCFYRFKKLFEIISHNAKKYSLSFLVIALVFMANVLLETILGIAIDQIKLGTIVDLLIKSALVSSASVYFVFVNCMLLAKSADRSLAGNI